MPIPSRRSSIAMAGCSRDAPEADLAAAIEHGEFVLHYQPVIDIRRGEPVGAEALIRWVHPQRGLLTPASFIPLAEATSLIHEVGRWTIAAACAQVREWENNDLRGLKISINASGREFSNPRFLKSLVSALEANEVGARQIEIELTETAYLEDTVYVRTAIARLHELGVSIALDDFGRAYSSFSYLKNFHADKIKIDREFVDQVHRHRISQVICHSIIDLARQLGMQVQAEGVEMAEEVQHLADAGCHLFQGYYFSNPLPADAFQRRIETLRRDGVPAFGSIKAQPGLQIVSSAERATPLS
ncbi:putative bifunctional diguanylate cyclase/phosphodiesterase [Consotaella aegiceratis]|uniref:putative bifunctional diguanylate cyclase/phosphodiesterase n=1 Tax=Consotaella aegiceratis TaxID=3097961 RepID=UPI002F41B2FC